ncbi:MAG: 5'/3'-nucleotidase SurE [Deltaproteobacteria bacterium]|jgi:5'-nucleotidase|nr:5'/3'-nucleotidase SurE [Deltaproteobacteria bacterium]
MRILLSNDDGIQADGLRAAYASLKAAGHEVLACAPDGERSGSSHSVNLRWPLDVKRCAMPDGAEGWAVGGSPADSVRIGLELFADPPFDLMISGFNNDLNLGFDTNYSGTVGAALEAAAAFVPTVAASVERSEPFQWERDSAILVDVVSRLAGWNIPPGTVVNLNIPSRIRHEGYFWCPVNPRPAKETYLREEREPGVLKCTRQRRDTPVSCGPGTDVDLFSGGRVTLSPIRPVGTDPETLERLVRDFPSGIG